MFSQSAQYYDVIYSARGKDYEAEASRLHELILEHSSGSADTLLDVACGTGAHLVFLKDLYEVQGLDLDKAMLEIARQKLPYVRFHQGDMTDFSLEQEFDIVVCLFSSIGYVGTGAKLELAIGNMARHAKPGGLVIVEPWIYPEDFEPGEPRAIFLDSPELKLARMDVSEVKDGVSILDFHYLVASSSGVRQFTERQELALFAHDEYVLACELANLKVIHDEEGLDGRGLYVGIKRSKTEE